MSKSEGEKGLRRVTNTVSVRKIGSKKRAGLVAFELANDSAAARSDVHIDNEHLSQNFQKLCNSAAVLFYSFASSHNILQLFILAETINCSQFLLESPVAWCLFRKLDPSQPLHHARIAGT